MNEDNHVFSWGHNHRGQCGRGVTQIVCSLSCRPSVPEVLGLCLEYSTESMDTYMPSKEFKLKYYNSWPEGKHLYIQMEFCSQNLRNILEVKPQVFGRQIGEAMDCV
ncbi:unnamed protein product, partial [Oppiella nova]